jgi:NADPH2:quinone reductase
VLATASSDDKLDRLKEYGLDHGINYRERDFVEAAREITAGKGVDLVVDSVGTTLQGSIDATAYRGRIISVGNAGRSEDRKLDISGLSGANRSLTGVFLGAEALMNTSRVYPMIEGLIRDMHQGKLRPVIDRTFPLSEAAAAHEYIESRQAFGRVLLVP